MNLTHKNCHGLTLIEMLITVIIMSILMATSLPALGRLVDGARMNAARSMLMVTLARARMVAVERDTYAVVCPTNDGAHCVDHTTWHNGWLVFADQNRNAKRDLEEKLLEVVEAQGPKLAITSSTGRDHVTYFPDGSAPGTNLTLTLCDARGVDYASTVVVSNVGRVRSGKPNASAAAKACSAIVNS